MQDAMRTHARTASMASNRPQTRARGAAATVLRGRR